MTWLGPFVMQTLSVIAFCIMGVAGVTGDVEVTEYGYAVEVPGWETGVAIPPFGYYGDSSPIASSEFVMHHEQYHLIQYQNQPVGYYLAVGFFSFGSHVLGGAMPGYEIDANVYARTKTQ